jgi:hypothetical protein
VETNYSPSLPEGTRVRLTLKGHRESSHLATVKRILPNPSRRHDRQWYDVRFDSGVCGRFIERDLDQMSAVSTSAIGNQASVA